MVSQKGLFSTNSEEHMKRTCTYFCKYIFFMNGEDYEKLILKYRSYNLERIKRHSFEQKEVISDMIM